MARGYKNVKFAEGLKMPLADFKKMFKSVIPLGEMEEAYQIATNGNIERVPKKSKKVNKD